MTTSVYRNKINRKLIDDIGLPVVMLIDAVDGGSNYDCLIVRTVAFPVQVAYWIKRS